MSIESLIVLIDENLAEREHEQVACVDMDEMHEAPSLILTKSHPFL